PSVSELLEQTKAQSLAAQRHQDIPFEQVVELAQPVRSLSHSPMFQVMFAWQNAVESSLELRGLALLPLPSPHKVAQFDLTLSLREEEETIVGGIEYATSLFEPATIERYLGYFRTLLEAMVADDTRAVHRLSMLPESERHQLLYEWNDTKTEYPADKCVHQLFEEQAAQRPEAVAVVFEDQELTYEDLNLRANQLGNYLVKLGVGPEVRVGICMERSPEMVVGLLGVLKAGGAYVPLDPVYPADRLTYMVQDAKIEVLLTQSKFQQRLPDYAGRLIEFDVDWELIAGESGSSFVSVSKVIAENLAYVIYTSGSTGKPKGVAVEHCQVCNQLFWAGAALSLGLADRVLQKASFSFDASILEIFLPLARGAQIIIAKPGGERDVDYLVRLVIEKAVTYVDLVPALLEQMLEHPTIKQWTSLRVMSCGAEILKPELVSVFYQSLSGELWNTYGPTEATVQSTFTACTTEEGQNVPIGRPIANTQIYILDAYTQPVPQGVTGELCIGGGGVARGYLNQEELTAERFIADGFSGTAGARLYRTGDLGRWLADGNIEFLGRNDFQVKIRGFRIELGEIEARLAEHPEVREAVVLAREDTAGEKRLVAYYTASRIGEAEAASVGAERLRLHLSVVLPDYMVPAAYVRLESLPLTPNGKLDRKALPAPEQEAYAVRSYEEPVGEMETKLAEVWAEVLQLEKVGRHDNFFELGGHSLLAVRVVSRLQQVLSVEVAIRDLFVHPELADLARHLQGAAHAELSRIIPVQQQRLWFLPQMEGASERGLSHSVRPASEGRSQPHSSSSGAGPDIGSS
ncbi:MAG: amino acid adenylation domain-containing protein, partial [Candidatus Sulfotelmatobacter sp.]